MDRLSSWQGRRVLVTGSTGFVGQHVRRWGIDAGIEVWGSSRTDAVSPEARHLKLDLCDRTATFATLDEIRPVGILHLAAGGVRQGSHELSVLLQQNVVGTENLLAAAAALPSPPVVVMAGSGIEYAPLDRPIREDDRVAPTSAYGVAKASAALCGGFYSARLSITLLRLFNVYGPGEREPRLTPHVVRRALRGERIELTSGDQIRDFCYVGDVAECFWRALVLHAGPGSLQVMNVGSGAPIRLNDFVRAIAHELVRRGVDEPRLDFGAIPYRPGEPMCYAGEIALLRRRLGWVPDTPLEQGLGNAVDSIMRDADAA